MAKRKCYRKKAVKASGTNITRKGATKGAVKSAAAKQEKKTSTKRKGVVKSAQKTVEQVVADVRLVTNGKMEVLEVRKGLLYRGGEQMVEFTEESLRTPLNRHPWDCHVTLVERSWGRISANSHGVTVHMYTPEEDFPSTEILAEIIMEQVEDMCSELLTKDAKEIIAKMKSLKPEA